MLLQDTFLVHWLLRSDILHYLKMPYFFLFSLE
jgi:hypothetical protein